MSRYARAFGPDKPEATYIAHDFEERTLHGQDPGLSTQTLLDWTKTLRL